MSKILTGYALVGERLGDQLRGTTLDPVSETEDSVFNAEIPLVEQSVWDLRILAHGAGLVHHQLKRGFDWKGVDASGSITNNRGETEPEFQEVWVFGIVVGNPIVIPQGHFSAMPWYHSEAWAENEFVRTFSICDPTRPHF